MAFLDRVLDPPSYGWDSKPTAGTLLREMLSRINVFRSRKNWLAFSSWFWTLALIPFVLGFFIFFFSWPLAVLGFVYSMVGMGTQGTIWFHRYGTHRAYVFRHPIFRLITRNLTIKTVPDEIYIVSHHVHHAKSEEDGDPYNSLRGGLYCFLADTNHQPIAKDLTPEEYARVVKLVEHTGIHANSYEQYLKWGSVAHPAWTTLHYLCNWAFWYGALWLIGGHALAFALFGFAHFWAVGIRTFNYAGHGAGKDRRKEGFDFNWRDLSVNQYWPGIVAGEWHNNHHLYPNSARSGFLPQQIDFAWYYIKLLHLIGAVKSYRDNKTEFYDKHYLPYRQKVAEARSKPA